jgi:hypothetical protein
MNASQLLESIRVHGGEVRIAPTGKLEVRHIPKALRAQLRRNAYLVRAVLREEIASEAWETCRRNPKWWESFGSTPVPWVSCRCSALEFPHVHEGARQDQQ